MQIVWFRPEHISQLARMWHDFRQRLCAFRPEHISQLARIGEQVGLIRSIAEQHLGNVQRLVMESVSRGRDLHYLSVELRKRYGITKRRAALIARDQNNKATATLQSARQLEMGITHGIWRHSHAGKEPRPSHVKADGEKFDLRKGMFLDGKWTLPGHEINCRCWYSPILTGKPEKPRPSGRGEIGRHA